MYKIYNNMKQILILHDGTTIKPGMFIIVEKINYQLINLEERGFIIILKIKWLSLLSKDN